MTTPADDRARIGPLIASGALDELRELMLSIWPPSRPGGPDYGELWLLLRLVHEIHGERATRIYEPYAVYARSEDLTLTYAGLGTVVSRSDVLMRYEGADTALRWLQELAPKIPYPDSGIVDLAVGLVREKVGDFEEARRSLGAAVRASMTGVEWFRIQALNAMVECLCRLGEGRLAFQYVRASCLESYKLVRVNSPGLYRALLGNALMFGQIDYALALQGNVARSARRKNQPSQAAVAESDVGLHAARIGSHGEAVQHLLKASEDAAQGSHPGDPSFSAVCRLLARFIDPRPLDPAGVDQWLAPGPATSARDLVADTQRALREGGRLPPSLVPQWQGVCRPRDLNPGATNVEAAREASEEIHLAALLARLAFEGGDGASGEALTLAILSAPTADAISWFCRERYVEHLLRIGAPTRARAVAEPFTPGNDVVQRFLGRQLIARCLLADEQVREAFSWAKLALEDWTRVMEGLYAEEHKVAWLERGASCLSCAMAALRESSVWISEHQRRRELFLLIELGKARLTTDMVSRRAHLPGVYFLPTRRTSLTTSLRGEHRDWWPPIILEMASFSDALSTVFHEEGGTRTAFLDVEPLKVAVQLPLSPEKQLLATASPLAFEEGDAPVSMALYDDLRRASAERD